MSEELKSQEPQEVVVPTKEESFSLTKEVKELIAASGDKVRSRVVDHLVEKVLAERVDLVLKGLEKQQTLQRDLQKCKPDIKSVSGDGKVEERWSEAKFKEKKELEEKLKKLSSALELALSDKADYEPLKKAVS